MTISISEETDTDRYAAYVFQMARERGALILGERDENHGAWCENGCVLCWPEAQERESDI